MTISFNGMRLGEGVKFAKVLLFLFSVRNARYFFVSIKIETVS